MLGRCVSQPAEGTAVLLLTFTHGKRLREAGHQPSDCMLPLMLLLAAWANVHVWSAAAAAAAAPNAVAYNSSVCLCRYQCNHRHYNTGHQVYYTLYYYYFDYYYYDYDYHCSSNRLPADALPMCVCISVITLGDFLPPLLVSQEFRVKFRRKIYGANFL